MNSPLLNTLLLNASSWLWDYYLLATVLLVVMLVFCKLVKQPARRIALHWSVAVSLALLACLCAVPGWSVVHMLSASPEPVPFSVTELEQPINVYPEAVVSPEPLAFEPSELPTEIIEDTNDANTETFASFVYGVFTAWYGSLSLRFLAAGSLFALLWLALGVWQVRRLRRQALPAPVELIELLVKLSGDRETPELGIVAKLPVAAAVGLLRPMVLLPQSFLEHTRPEELKTVLAHELAHIRHRDLWLLSLLRGLLLLLWPHPLYWLWRQSVRLDQETLADVAAADVTNRADYAEQLVAWARVASEVRTPRLASSVGLWESPSQLKRRIAILLDEKLMVLRACSQRWRVSSAVLLLLVAGGLSLCTLQPATDAADSIDTEISEQAEESVKGLAKITEHEFLQRAADQGVIRRLDPKEVPRASWIPNGFVIRAVYQFDPREVLKKAKDPFDKKAGYEDAFEGVLKGLEKDPFGPQVNVERDLISNLAGTILELVPENDADFAQAPKLFFAVSVRNEEALKTSVAKFMRADPYALLIRTGKQPVWRITNEKQAGGAGVCIARGQLLIASDIKILQEFLIKQSAANSKSDQPSTIDKPIDPVEIATQQELVDGYEEIFKKIEALHKLGVVGGEIDKLLLAKYHMQNARAKLLELQNKLNQALKNYESAMSTAEEYVPAAQATYDTGRIPLKELLQAQELRAQAKSTWQQAKRRLAKAGTKEKKVK